MSGASSPYLSRNASETWPWGRALGWVLFLAPFFFLTYNFANDFASRLGYVPSLGFSWERHLPFLAWSIVPYWSSDLLYGLSFAACRTRTEMDLHGKRLVAIQVLSVICFLLFPLRCTFERPVIDGPFGEMFAALLSFDRPFNQAPSLHVSLAVILWARYKNFVAGPWRWVAGIWFVLMGLSAWTTYQHHFIDLPLGYWAGRFVLAVGVQKPKWPRLAALYLAASAALAATAFAVQSWGWLLLWPAYAVSMVGAAYWSGDSTVLRKQNGRMPWDLAPYWIGAWINSRLWTRKVDSRNEIADGVWIGRAPSASDRGGVVSIVDLTAELPVAADRWVPVLDLTAPSMEDLTRGVEAIEVLEGRRPTLICCALGYSRSATVAAAWLVKTARANTVQDALAVVRNARPQVVISPVLEGRLNKWAAEQRLFSKTCVFE